MIKKMFNFIKSIFIKKRPKENWIEVNNKYKNKTYRDYFDYYELHSKLSKQCFVSWKCNCEWVSFRRELKNNALLTVCDKLAKNNI